MCDFRPGDEVVCVDDSVHYGFERDENPLRKGAVYCVNSVVFDDFYSQWGVVLSGITSVGFMGGFKASRFRKVVRKSDKLSLTEWLSQPSGDTERLDKSKKRNRVNG